MQPIEPERTLSYVPVHGDLIRYSLAVPILMTALSRRSWLVGLGLVLGAAWWAVAGIARHQTTWWLGFAITPIAVAAMGVVFAVAVFRRESHNPTYPVGQAVVAALTPDLVTFTSALGEKRIRRIDIDRITRAFGFVILGAGAQGAFWIVPRQLVPPELFADYRARSIGATA